ncbi:hypothetical protein Tco_0919157 [Tanacetum coccineum]
MAKQDIPPPTITAMKIPIIRKGEYDIWSMRMRQYICHIDHNLWDVIVNGDLEEEPAPKNREKLLLSLSTNEVSTASGDFGVSTAGGINQVPSTPCAHDMDGDDLEELDLRWQVAMLTVRGTLLENADLEGIKGEDLMVTMAGAMHQQMNLHHRHWYKSSKQFLESFKTLQKNYNTEREKYNKAKLEIRGYEIALESLESRVLGHERNELAWGEKYEFQNYELKCREIKINNLNLELEKIVKERDELKDKIAKWEESTKNLHEILSSQLSARDKTGQTNDANTEKPKSASESVVSNPKIDRDRVIIED